jgi:hypothetical protein
MALTNLQGNYIIDDMKSLYRPIIHAFGDNQAVPLPTPPAVYTYNRFIFDVYINGVMVLREYKAINFGTTVFAYLDVAPIVKNYIQANISSMVFPYIEYQVKYGVEDAITGVITTNVVTETSYAWYGYPSFLNDDLTADLGGSYLEIMWLSTNRNRVLQLYGNYRTYIPIYKSQSYYGSVVEWIYNSLTYQRLDSTNNGVYNTAITTADLDISQDVHLLESFAVSGDNIQNIPNFTIQIDTNCTKNNPVMLHFLNSMGGFESFLFSGVNRVNTNIERQSINKLGLITTYTSSGLDRDVSLDRVANGYLGEVKTNYSNTMTHKIKLVSDYVSETDFLWLREMLASPQVYAQIDNNALMIPVTIETSDWAEKKRGADKIFNLEIDILLGTQSTQLR